MKLATESAARQKVRSSCVPFQSGLTMFTKWKLP